MEKDQPVENISKARLILSVMSALDDDVVDAFLDTGFKSHLLRRKHGDFRNSSGDCSSG